MQSFLVLQSSALLLDQWGSDNLQSTSTANEHETGHDRNSPRFNFNVASRWAQRTWLALMNIGTCQCSGVVYRWYDHGPSFTTVHSTLFPPA